MWRPSLFLLGLTIAAPASASFLDSDFWCRTYGCAVVHDGQTYDIYDNWQFSTNSCCVLPGSEMISYYTRAGTPLVTGTLDRVGDGPDNGESLMLEIVDGGNVYDVNDDGDGVLDASDTLTAFALNPSTDLRIGSDTRRYSHSFYVTSRNTPFSIRGFARVRDESGELGDLVELSDISFRANLSQRGNDEGWDYGRRANGLGFDLPTLVNDLGDIASGPTQLVNFLRPLGIRSSSGDINEQVIRFDFEYELPEYDMSMGTGELGIDVEFSFYREPDILGGLP